MLIIDSAEYLTEWMEKFLKNKDLILKKIEHIEKGEDLMIARLRDGKEHAYLVEPFLTDVKGALERLKKYDVCSIVVFNTKENFDTVVKNWDELAGFKRHFSIHFVNPFSNEGKRWTVYPMTHSMISGRKGLKQGLESIASNVERAERKELERMTAREE
ncbi:MAG: hypothetical protein R6U32_02650 [Candidatus Woesearchaeota archaeon]